MSLRKTFNGAELTNLGNMVIGANRRWRVRWREGFDFRRHHSSFLSISQVICTNCSVKEPFDKTSAICIGMLFKREGAISKEETAPRFHLGHPKE
jgi:hypothetical protein